MPAHATSRDLVFVVSCALATVGTAQCTLQPDLLTSLSGTDGVVHAATMWDPDGTGPAAPLCLLGGQFSVAGTAAANNVVAWEPNSGAWTSLGSGTNGVVRAFATLPTGQLVVGGTFTNAGGIAADNVAIWNGTSWSALGTGCNAGVHALEVRPSGTLAAGGEFGIAGGAPANFVAEWNGTSWSALGTGTNNPVHALASLASGELIAGGAFGTAGGLAAPHIAQWNGTAWAPMAGGGTDDDVLSLCELPGGTIAVGGMFATAGGLPAAKVAAWNGGWSTLGPGFSLATAVHSLTALPGGGIAAGGYFGASGATALANIATWNGAAWSALGSGCNQQVRALVVLPGGDLVAGGYFLQPAPRIARWNGATWTPLQVGFDGQVLAVTSMPDGDLVVGGTFPAFGGVAAANIARRTGGTWTALGTGIAGTVMALLPLPNGDLVASGQFSSAGGVAASHIARWNGTTWSPLGPGLAMPASALALLPNGDIVANAGMTTSPSAPTVVRWNGTSWSLLGNGIPGWASALVVLPNGDLYAGGTLAVGFQPLNPITRWNGTTWSQPGAALLPHPFQATAFVSSMHLQPNGDLVVAGGFERAGSLVVNNIARWNGTSWSAFGSGLPRLPAAISGYVTTVTGLPDGDLVAGGVQVTPSGTLARWNGTAWVPFAASASFPGNLHFTASGTLLATAGNAPLYGAEGWGPRLMAIDTTCPAVSSPLGVGCPSTGGANALAAATLPWVDSTFRATGSGMVPSMVVLTLTGFSPVAPPFPLAAVLPSLPGCNLLVTPDLLDLLITTPTGTGQSSLFLVNTPPLVGVTFYQQWLPLETDASGTLVAVTATNALQLTAGIF